MGGGSGGRREGRCDTQIQIPPVYYILYFLLKHFLEVDFMLTAVISIEEIVLSTLLSLTCIVYYIT